LGKKGGNVHNITHEHNLREKKKQVSLHGKRIYILSRKLGGREEGMIPGRWEKTGQPERTYPPRKKISRTGDGQLYLTTRKGT